MAEDFFTSEMAVIIGLLSNIVLALSIQLQKYAKRKIIHLALHGLPSVSSKLIWSAAISLLLAAECSNLIQYGVSPLENISALGVYTIVSNCVLPPLMFDHTQNTVFGAMLYMSALFIQIVKPSTEHSRLGPFLFDNSTKLLLMLELASCLIALYIQSLDSTNYTRRFISSILISGLVGSTAVAGIQFGSSNENVRPEYVLLFVIVCWIIEIVVLSYLLRTFPVWQVVPHHFSVFTAYMYFNTGVMYQGFTYANFGPNVIAGLANVLIIVGSWVGAKPHLDIPNNILESGDFCLIRDEAQNQMEQRATQTQQQAAATPGSDMPPGCTCLDSDSGYYCMCDVYMNYKSNKDKGKLPSTITLNTTGVTPSSSSANLAPGHSTAAV